MDLSIPLYEGVHPRVEFGTPSIEAARDSLAARVVPTFSLIAYGGGVVQHPKIGHPMVFDLKGMVARLPTLPVLRDHDIYKIVGHADVWIDAENGAVKLEGQLSGAGEAAEEVRAAALNGFPWRCSMDASVDDIIDVEKGRETVVNGQTFAGPVSIVTRSELNTVSFVSMPFSEGTGATVG